MWKGIRLSKGDEEVAKGILRSALWKNPEGMRTSQLADALQWRISLRVIARLLREIPGIEHSYEGTGYMAASWWKLKD
jgi:hypothetical protein